MADSSCFFFVVLDPFCEHVEKDLEEKDIEQLKETFSKPLKYTKEEVCIPTLLSFVCLIER